MEINKLHHQQGIGFKSDKKVVQETQSNQIDTENKKLPVDPSYYQNIKGVSFKGANFLDDVKDTQRTKSLVLDGNDTVVKSYKKDGREYLELENGKLYRVRYSKNPDKNAETVLASKLYNLAGIKTPDMKVLDNNGMFGYISEYTDNLSSISNNSQLAYDNFGTDAWLGNWNAYNDFNTAVTQDGELIKLVTSGSLSYRASGKKKDNFNADVQELNTLKNPDTNPRSAEIFKDMSDDDMIESLRKVADIMKNDIILTVQQSQVKNKQEMIDTLLNRQNTIKLVLDELEQKHKEKVEPTNIDNVEDTLKTETKDDTKVDEPKDIEVPIQRRPRRSQKYSYHPPINADFMSNEDKAYYTKKIDDYLAQDYNSLQELRDKEMYSSIQYILNCNPELKANLGYLEDHYFITPYSCEKILRNGYISEKLPALTKVAMEDRNHDDFRTLAEMDIPVKYLNEQVFTNDDIKFSDIIKDYENRQQQYKSELGLSKKLDIKPEIEENVVKFMQDDYAEIPAYKLDVLDYLIETDKEAFFKPYSSYTCNGPRCLASSLLEACKTEKETYKFIDELLPKYKKLVPEFDNKSSADFRELLRDDQDKDFAFKKIKMFRNDLTFSSYNIDRYDWEIKKTDENTYNVLNDLINSDIKKSRIFDVLHAVSKYNKDDTKSYNQESIKLAKELATKTKNIEHPAGDEMVLDILRANTYKENVNNSEGVQNKIDTLNKAIDMGLFDFKMHDRVPVDNRSYWENPKDIRSLYKEEIEYLVKQPKDKVDFIVDNLDIEGRNYQFRFDELDTLYSANDNVKRNMFDYKIINQPEFTLGDVMELSNQPKEVLEQMERRNLLKPSGLLCSYNNGETNSTTNLKLNKLSDEIWQKVIDRDLLNKVCCVKTKSSYTDNYEIVGSGKLDVDQAIKLANLSDEEYDKINNSGWFEKYDKNAVFNYIDLKGFADKRNISDLSNNQKRELLNNLIKYNSKLFSPDFQSLTPTPQFTPKNKEEYCNLVQNIVDAIGLNYKPISSTTKSNFYNTLENIENLNGEFLNTDFSKEGLKIDLKYSRKDFMENVNEIIKKYPKEEQAKITNYFGFELKTNNDNLIMNGYPADNQKNNTYSYGYTIQKAIEQVREEVDKFTDGNEVLSNADISPRVAKELNDITKAFPELYTIIGKGQHKTHSYDVGIHTLNVLQDVMKNPQYRYLSKDERQILQIATLFHDLTKQENVVDKSHPQYSAFDTYSLVDKLELGREKKLQIYEIIKNHDFLEHYDMSNAKDYAFNLRQGNSFKMETILTEADLKGVSRDKSFYSKYKNKLDNAKIEIGKLIDNLQETAIVLPQTKIPKASQLRVDGENVKDVISKDSVGKPIKNRMIYLKPNMNLKDIGFESNIKSDDLNVLVHGLDESEQSATFQALGQVDSNALLSTSYVNYGKGNYHVFRQHGFVLDVASDDINVAYYRDFGSGCGKNIDTLKSQYLFDGFNKNMRTYMPDAVKKELNLTDEEYKKLYKEISDKPIEELDKTHPKVAMAYRDIINNMEEGKRSHGRQYNEILVSRPQIQGVFYQGEFKYGQPDIESVPLFLREYAEEHNLPIIYFGK